MSDTERRTVTVTVFDGEKYWPGNDWPTPGYDAPLLGAIEWFQSKLNEIPEPYRGGAKCEITQERDYEDSNAHITIWYDRPETDEEYEDRMVQKEQARQLYEKTAHLTDRRGEAKETVRGLGPGLKEMRKRGLTE